MSMIKTLLGFMLYCLALAACGSIPATARSVNAIDPSPHGAKATATEPASRRVTDEVAVTSPAPSATTDLATETPIPPTATSPTLRNLPQGTTLELKLQIGVPRTGFGVDLAFSSWSDKLYHSGIGGRVQEVTIEGDQTPREFASQTSDYMVAVAMAPSGRYLAANDGSNLQVWDLASGESVAFLPLAQVSVVLHLGFLEGGMLYGADTAGNVALWESSRWEQVARIQYGAKTEAVFVLEDPRRIVMQLTDSSEAIFLDLEGNRLAEVELAGESPQLISVSPGGDQLLVYANRGFAAEGATLVDATSGEALHFIPLRNLNALAVSPQWTILAAVTSSDVLRLFNLPDGNLLLTQILDIHRIRTLAISPDDLYLGTHSLSRDNEQGIIQIWARGDR